MNTIDEFGIIMDRFDDLEAQIAEMSGGAPPVDTTGPDWIGREGQRKRNPKSDKWDAAHWNIQNIKTRKQVDISGFKQIVGQVTGPNIVSYGGYSYEVMLFPADHSFSCYVKGRGNASVTLLDPKPLENGRHVVLDYAILADSKSFVYKAGSVKGPYVLCLQASQRKNCGSVYSNDV